MFYQHDSWAHPISQRDREKLFPNVQHGGRDYLLYNKRIMVLEDLGSQISSGNTM